MNEVSKGSDAITAAAEILCFPVSVPTREQAAAAIVKWAEAHESRAVLAANVHMVMEARDDPQLRAELAAADLSVPDGKPLVWALQLLGVQPTHIRGTDLTLEVCRQAEAAGVPVGLYGSTPSTLAACRQHLAETYPSLQIPFAVSPPFRALTQTEDEDMVESIRESGARILFVSLGCPKQERWMMAHRDRVPCVTLGVGAAFAFLGGVIPEAPRWIQRAGLEWAFRLASDPRGLWRRYLTHNPRFVVLFGIQYARHILGWLRNKATPHPAPPRA